MWETDGAVEVHSVDVDGVETPDQFLWRGRLWRVCSIRSHWTETAAWWERGIIGHQSLTYDGRPDHWTHAESARARVAATAGSYAGHPAAEAGVPAAEACSTGRAASRATRIHKNGAAAPASPRSLADCLAAFAPGGGAPGPAPAGSAIDELGGEPGHGMSTSPAAVGLLDADWGPRRAVYRVEAGCGRHGRRELFDLAHDPDSDRWQLERVMDR